MIESWFRYHVICLYLIKNLALTASWAWVIIAYCYDIGEVKPIDRES